MLVKLVLHKMACRNCLILAFMILADTGMASSQKSNAFSDTTQISLLVKGALSLSNTDPVKGLRYADSAISMARS
ncbi:MAG: hypothetical protein ACTHJ8_01325, partial [Mucilaginibacter sp.]